MASLSSTLQWLNNSSSNIRISLGMDKLLDAKHYVEQTYSSMLTEFARLRCSGVTQAGFTFSSASAFMADMPADPG